MPLFLYLYYIINVPEFGAQHQTHEGGSPLYGTSSEYTALIIS